MLADLQEAAEFPLITRRMLAKQSRIEHPWSSWNMVDSNESLFMETIIVQLLSLVVLVINSKLLLRKGLCTSWVEGIQ